MTCTYVRFTPQLEVLQMAVGRVVRPPIFGSQQRHMVEILRERSAVAASNEDTDSADIDVQAESSGERLADECYLAPPSLHNCAHLAKSVLQILFGKMLPQHPLKAKFLFELSQLSDMNEQGRCTASAGRLRLLLAQ